MLHSSPIAFKEWAAICLALAQGRQSIILRKGGIHEGREGFRVAQGEFWLFPTYFHESDGVLVDEARPFLDQANSERPAPGILQLSQYCVVTDVVEVHDETRLTHLAGQHVWSPQTVNQRFHYRTPGLFVLIVRTYCRTPPHVIPESPHFAGCRSWVELPQPLSTSGLQAVLDDEAFQQQRERALHGLNAGAIT